MTAACSSRSRRDTTCRAKIAEDAALARRPARVANATAVPDEQVRKASPVAARDELHQVALDFDGILLSRQAEPLRETAHVRVDDDPLHVAELRCDDVGR